MKLTSRMTKEELAKVWAEHFGMKGAPGGWIYTDIKETGLSWGLGWTGKPIAHGWGDLANALIRTGCIEVGVGIDWRRTGEKPLVWRSQGMTCVRPSGVVSKAA
jgi:hypothetical protein